MELFCALLLMTIMPRKASPRTESGGRRAPFLSWCGSSSPISRVESISLWTQSDRDSKHSSDCVRNSLTATREHIVEVVSTMTPVTLASLLMFGREVDQRVGIERLSESFEDSIDGIMDDTAVK